MALFVPVSPPSGLLCHLDDACVSNPCNEGAVCDTNPLNGRAICTCPAGFVGGACNQDMDECSIGANPCEHFGKCVNTEGSFQCQCGRGYAGPRCEIDINECLSMPCQNDATCLDRIGEFTCICMPGRTTPRPPRDTSQHRTTARELQLLNYSQRNTARELQGTTATELQPEKYS
eukprot:XP_014046023.1 PREDICTED: neurogenic locus notch homolog protein 3-like [Salmo salar]